MTVDTPYTWLLQVATDDPKRPCLVDAIGVLSYGEVRDRVESRARSIAEDIEAWEIVPVEVAIDVDSVVEILAVQRAGGVPLPYIGRVPEPPISFAREAVVCIETSGSTGMRKIVPLTFENLQASVRASRERLGNVADDRWLVCLPLNHVGGLSIIWRTLEAGGSAVVAPFDPSGGVIERLSPTIASMVPTMVHRLVTENPDALASIAWVLVGGAALGLPLWERCVRAGVRLVPTYGLTEAGSQVATAQRGISEMSIGSVGAALVDMEVVVVGFDHEPVRSGHTGLIAIEGPAVFNGYLGEGRREGRFVTSDLGRLDAEGHLHVEGRADDVILSGGENVSLGRVAGIIIGMGGVDDVCVVGIEDAEWGTVGAAMVVCDGGLESIATSIGTDLMEHERPKRWLQRYAIPRLSNGKHDLVAVRAAFEEESWT